MSEDKNSTSVSSSFVIRLLIIAVIFMVVGPLGVFLSENYSYFDKSSEDAFVETLRTLLRIVSVVIFGIGVLISLSLLFRQILRFGSSSAELEGVTSVIGTVFGTIPFLDPVVGIGQLYDDEKKKRIKHQEEFLKKVEGASSNATNILLISWERLNIEERRLAARSLLTLASGVLLTAVAICLLIYFTISFDSKIDALEVTGSHLTFLLPRITGVLIIQVLAAFFLRMYLASENAISINKAELTNVEMRIASLGLATSANNKFELAKLFAVEERLSHLNKSANLRNTELNQNILNSLIKKVD